MEKERGERECSTWAVMAHTSAHRFEALAYTRKEGSTSWGKGGALWWEGPGLGLAITGGCCAKVGW